MEMYGKNFVLVTWDDEVFCRVSQKESISLTKEEWDRGWIENILHSSYGTLFWAAHFFLIWLFDSYYSLHSSLPNSCDKYAVRIQTQTLLRMFDITVRAAA